ncbi:MAG: hypothetical protein RIE84_16125 [Parvibaculum sp.]|uniref:hypothetical protein n=1 Tax=Parvibaculum sp. TaxID=2024848 RepID=UPI0032EDC03F
MSAFTVGGELDLIDGEEVDLAFERHRLDRADEIAGRGGQDLFLARDESHRAAALDLHDPVVDFAGKEPERQADHAGLVSHHPLDGEVGLAGVGGTENGGDAAAFSDAVADVSSGVLRGWGTHVPERTFDAKPG